MTALIVAYLAAEMSEPYYFFQHSDNLWGPESFKENNASHDGIDRQ